MTNYHRSCIEALEDRIAPAGIVNVIFDAATGALTIMGDGAANSVDIYRTGKDSYRVENAGDGTQIQLGAGISNFQDVLGRVRTLTIDGGDGFDTIQVINLSTLDRFTFEASADVDQLFLTNLGTKGAAEFNFGADGGDVITDGLTKIGGDLMINYVTDGNFFLGGEGAAISGAVHIAGGSGSGLASFGGEKLTIGKGVTYNTNVGGGILSFNAANTVIGKGATAAIEMTTGAGGGTLNAVGGPLHVKGAIHVAGGSGYDFVDLSPSELRVDGDFKVVGGLGSAFVKSSVTGMSSFKGAIEIDLGADSAETSFVEISGGVLTVGKGFTVKGGAGIDNIRISGTTVNLLGPLNFDLGTGADVLQIRGTRLLVSNGLLFNGGSGNDDLNVVVARILIEGPTTLLAGDGNDTFDFTATSLTLAGALRVAGGLGDDLLEVSGTNVFLNGNLLFKGEGGDDTLDIEFSKTVLRKGFDFTGGDGFNSVAISTNLIEAGGGLQFITGDDGGSVSLDSQALKLAKGITITGGAGSDSVQIISDGVITGDVTLDLAAGFNQQVQLRGQSGLVGNLRLGGKLTVSSGATVSDGFFAADLTVSKAVNIMLGAGTSSVGMENFTAGDLFTLHTGAGDDLVNLDRSSLFGPSLFRRLATIQLGADNDAIRIGQSITAGGGTNTAIFRAGLSVDGGTGDDDSNDFLGTAVNTITGRPKDRLSFETQTLV